MDTTEQNNQPSHRKLFIGLGAAIALILFITILAVIVLFFGGDKSQKATTPTDPKVVTKQTVEQNLSDATANLQQAKTDQTAAKAAFDDEQNRVRLSN